MEKETQAKLNMIIHHYGVRHQAKKLMEETAELAEAIQDYMDEQSKENKRHVEEELADCYVLINQFYLKFTEDAEKEERLIKQAKDKIFHNNTVISFELAHDAIILIANIAHYANTGKNEESVRTIISEYIAALSALDIELNLDDKTILSFFNQKIDRQLMRIKNENSI